MSINPRHIIIYLISLFVCLNLRAQDRTSLEAKKKKTEEEIQFTNQVLKKTQQERKDNYDQLLLVNKRIELREQLIHTMEDELEIIEEGIRTKENLIAELEGDLEMLKKDYARMIYRAWKGRGGMSKIMFILSAKNFNQAYRRIRYLEQYTEFRKQQGESIMQMQHVIAEEIDALEEQRNEKRALIRNKETERRSLARERNKKKEVVSSLSEREKELRRQLREKERIAARLEEEIERIIREEAERLKTSEIYAKLTPEQKLISDNFRDNQGKLPWPTERGVITSKFGRQPHPVLGGITIQNNGVDITTVEGAVARAIFKGEVTKVFTILGANYAVIMRHGNYLTVYQNLVDVLVKTGDQVETKQALGTVYTDKDRGTSVLHVEIWREIEKQDPEVWLNR